MCRLSARLQYNCLLQYISTQHVALFEPALFFRYCMPFSLYSCYVRENNNSITMCYDFSQDNDIIFNSLKYVYVVFRPKRYKLFCPPVYLHEEKLCRIHETKYLGYFLSEDQSDDAEISKQIRTLYIRSNKLLRMFSYCTIDVKKELFRSYCSSFVLLFFMV